MTAKIITVFNQKGGCGKTMISMQLGASLALSGFNVLIVDLDRQGTAAIWSSQAEKDSPFPAPVVSLAVQQERMIGEVEKFATTGSDIIILDCPPAIESSVPWAALNISDMGLIPVVPLLDNIWASKEACALGLRAKEENPTLQLAYVANKMRRGKVFEECLNTLRMKKDVQLLDPIIWERNAFPESQAYGTSVHGLGKTLPATKEIEELSSQVLKMLGLRRKK